MKNIYLVWCDYYGQTADDAINIAAADARTAAEHWAQLHDSASNEYSIAGGLDVIVSVNLDGNIERLKVSGESVAVYTARSQIK